MTLRQSARSILLPLLLVCSLTGVAKDVNDRNTRLNPSLDGRQSSSVRVDISNYPFISLRDNHIQMNGRSWDKLRQKFGDIATGNTVTVVHLGDSHIQAEGNTSRIRRHVQDLFGDAGRGLIIPFRMAGTNQPMDYKISSPTSMRSAKLLKKPWAVHMGFTGISLAAPQGTFELTFSCDDAFTRFIIMGSGHINVCGVRSGGQNVGFKTTTVSGGTQVTLDRAISSATATISASGAYIYGIDLHNNRSGVVYSAIGNNGAAFSHYTQIEDFGRELSDLHPDLVVISLGTNEAFGNMSDQAFYNTVNKLVGEIRRTNPQAELLLTTPSECQRSVYTTVRGGRRGRRQSRSVRSYAVNTTVARFADVIRRYGRDNHIPVYDFYKVAGGSGSSAKWAAAHLLGGDRIHRTWAGYRVEGDLFSDALIEALGHPEAIQSVEIQAENNTGRTLENDPGALVAGAFANSRLKNDRNNVVVPPPPSKKVNAQPQVPPRAGKAPNAQSKKQSSSAKKTSKKSKKVSKKDKNKRRKAKAKKKRRRR